MADVLTESTDARKMGLSLKHVEYGGQLLQQIMDSSKKMEQLHEKLNDMITKNVEDNSRYLKLIDVAENQIKWWDKAKAWYWKQICFV